MTQTQTSVPAAPIHLSVPVRSGGQAETPWWRSAIVYQVYIRSFADGDGDGVGDLAGLRARLPYLQELGVDAIWFTPWYASPLADGGYDVADYRAIDPELGTLAQAEELIGDAATMGIRVIVDVVPNHVSDRHPWFREALASPPGSPARQRFWFHPGRGDDGQLMPTSWISSFGGPTWTRIEEADGTLGDWYLHLFTAHQPDLNWNHPDVRREHEEVLQFWFDRGVAGIRVDSAAMLVKDPQLPELPAHWAPGTHPHLDRDAVHEIYRSWRAVADTYDEPRMLVGEVWLADADRFARYLRPDELHTAFNFEFMTCAWQAPALRESIDETLARMRSVGAPATWVLSNHDVTRPVTRYGRDESSFDFSSKRFGTPTDQELGTRRARAAALVTAALPGSLYIYQGDELGLPEVEDLPREAILDPMHFRSGGLDPGRDGCRVPLPWSGTGAPYGFSATGSPSPTWLPQPTDWAAFTVDSQTGNPQSMLSLYRAAIRLRRSDPAFRDQELRWLDPGRLVPGYTADPGCLLAFARGDVACIVSFHHDPIPLPGSAEVLLASEPLSHGHLNPHAAAWLRLSDS